MLLRRINTLQLGFALRVRGIVTDRSRPSMYEIDDDEDLSEFSSEVLLNKKTVREDTQARKATPADPYPRDLPFAPEQEELLSLLETITKENSQFSPLRMTRPSIPSRTFGVTLPPKWAAEVPRRLARLPCMMLSEKSGGEGLRDAGAPLSSRKVYLFQQVFIHPSFVRVDKKKSSSEESRDTHGDTNDSSSELSVENLALRFTNYPLTIQGHALIKTAVTQWAAGLYPNISAQVLNSLLSGDSTSPLLSDESFARIASVDWGIADLLLGDGKAYEKLIARQKKLATSGGISGSSGSLPTRPTSHLATIVPSLCSAVYLAHGMDVAMAFIEKHVLPVLVKNGQEALRTVHEYGDFGRE